MRAPLLKLLRAAAPPLCGLMAALPASAFAWGDDGHELVNRAAARGLPADVPECLRKAEARLTYLGPEPDRWRANDLPHMNKAFAPDHFVDLEWVVGIDLEKPPENRYLYAEALRAGGKKAEEVGFAPYMVVELCQRIEAAVVAVELVNADHPEAAERKRQAEEALIFATGVLGHYVGDLANPHHTTIFYNGWKGENPEGFATDRETHARFESIFVHRVRDALAGQVKVTAEPRKDLDYVRAIWALIQDSNEQVKPLYRLDRDGAFAEGSDPAKGTAFARDRMIKGATLLRDLWVTAFSRGALRARAIKLGNAIERALESERIELDVQVDLERRVTLRGKLDDPAQYRRAIAIANAVPGVQGLKSRVRVLY